MADWEERCMMDAWRPAAQCPGSALIHGVDLYRTSQGGLAAHTTCAELSTVMVMVMVTNRIDLESILD